MSKYPTLVFIIVLMMAAIINTQFCKTSGKKILDTNGKELFLKGIGIGNWLNPEGYMLDLNKINSFRTIDTAFSELLN
jgi:endoglucanase